MPIDDATTQNEIERLKREIAQLQAQLKAQQASVPIRSSTSSLVNDYDLIADMARFADSILTEQAIRKKYGFDEATWTRLAEDEALIEKIEAEKIRRTRNGSTARERAQQAFTTAPTILNDIMTDETKPSRHRIEAAREIRAVAATGPEAQSTTEMFHISINLGADEVLRISKPIAPGVDDDGRVIDNTMLPMIATKNREGNDGNGEPI